MRRVYHSWHSPALDREMELLEFGHAGLPILVFPTSKGRFFEYEDRGMVGALWDRLAAGRIRLYCVDSADAESWYNWNAHPNARIQRHVAYEGYLLHEVIPLMGGGPVAVTGCSFGGFHSVNFALRHPDAVSQCVSMGGAFDLHRFFGDYQDADLYYNQPLDYLPYLHDGWFLDRIRAMRLILATGERDICLSDNLRLSHVLAARGIGHCLDIWGDGTGHDWPWWQQMACKFF